MTKFISAKTTIKDLLEVNRDMVIEAMTALNKNFSRLKNPVLRNLFARRVTIADACKIAGCTIAEFMDCMKKIGFSIADMEIGEQGGPAQDIKINKLSNYAELDVRPLLSADKDPLKVILSHINNLEENQGLKLINTFEPLPLINLLSEKGFTSFTVTPAPDTVITYFSRSVLNSQKIIAGAENDDSDESFEEALKQFDPERIEYLDVRDLEMPKPMREILQHSSGLNQGDLLFVYHKKKPVFLIPELDKLGLKYLFKDISTGNVHMLIYKP